MPYLEGRLVTDSSTPLNRFIGIFPFRDALSEKGYNPIDQLVGYILTEEPAYITNYKNARGMIRRIDRDDLMAAMLKEYLGL